MAEFAKYGARILTCMGVYKFTLVKKKFAWEIFKYIKFKNKSKNVIKTKSHLESVLILYWEKKIQTNPQWDSKHEPSDYLLYLWEFI